MENRPATQTTDTHGTADGAWRPGQTPCSDGHALRTSPQALRDLCPPRTVALDYASTQQPPAGFARACQPLGVRSPNQLREIAVAVGVRAGCLVEEMRRAVASDTGHVSAAALKSSEVDPVTEVDRASERLIREELLRAVPGSAVLGEEEGLQDGADNEADSGSDRRAGSDTGDETGDRPEDAAGELLWVVDPIDGTVNFMYGVPAYAVSIAATIGGTPVAAAVVDVAHHQVYSACSGSDAFVQEFSDDGLVSSPTALSRLDHGDTGLEEAVQQGLSQALIATGFGYAAERRAAQARFLTHLLPRVRDIRRMGSAALDLCAVAAGRVDGYFEHGLGPWDHAAGVLIAARAGAVVCMPELTVQSADGVQVMVAKPSVAQALLTQLTEAGTGGAL